MNNNSSFDSRMVTSTALGTNLVITFYSEDEFGVTKRTTRTIAGIKQGASNDDINAAAKAVAQLIDHTRYDVKVVTTNLIEDDSDM